jgi:hypothetical protein
VDAPPGSTIRVVSGVQGSDDHADAMPIRLTDDPSATAMSAHAINSVYPLRQKEIVSEVKLRLGDQVRVTTHTLLCVRRAYSIDEKACFSYKPPFGSRLYSRKFADWIAAQHRKDPKFFDNAVAQYKQQHEGTIGAKPVGAASAAR